MNRLSTDLFPVSGTMHMTMDQSYRLMLLQEEETVRCSEAPWPPDPSSSILRDTDREHKRAVEG